MAIVVVDGSFPTGRLRAPLAQFDVWLDGQVWRLEPSDYHVSRELFLARLNMRACTLGGLLHAGTKGASLIVQFVPGHTTGDSE